MIRSIKFTGLAAFILASILTDSAVSAGEPTEQLSTTINKFVTILNNTPVPELQANGLPESARKLVFARFDFSEMTKRSLGSHWKDLEQKEQKEFVDAFTDRLLSFYGRSVRSSGNGKIQFNRETRDGKQATVGTKVVGSKGEETPIEYQMHDINGQWKVYDVVIDHVSMVNNYRAQFARVIAKSSVKDLLQKMKDRNQES
jgi:phospholipid transport system substrate-binding protein